MLGILVRSFVDSPARTMTKGFAICLEKLQNQQFFRQHAPPLHLHPQKIKLKIEKTMRFKKKNPLPIRVVKNTINDPTQTLTSQIHTDTKNRRLRRLNFLTLASIQKSKTVIIQKIKNSKKKASTSS